jgi:hypothetical protein
VQTVGDRASSRKGHHGDEEICRNMNYSQIRIAFWGFWARVYSDGGKSVKGFHPSFFREWRTTKRENDLNASDWYLRVDWQSVDRRSVNSMESLAELWKDSVCSRKNWSSLSILLRWYDHPHIWRYLRNCWLYWWEIIIINVKL